MRVAVDPPTICGSSLSHEQLDNERQGATGALRNGRFAVRIARGFGANIERVFDYQDRGGASTGAHRRAGGKK